MRPIGLALASVVIGLLMCEALLWWLVPLPSSLQGPVRKVLTQSLPGLKPEILYTEDQFGFRSTTPVEETKPPRTIRTLCLGASTTQQVAQATEDTWSALLQQRLQQALPPRRARIQVAAKGGGGLTVLDGVRMCRDMVPVFAPDVVVLLWGANDLAWHGGPDYQYPDPQRYASKKPPWKQFLRRHSQIYRRIMQLQKQLKVLRDLEEGRSVAWHSENLPLLRKQYWQYPFAETVQRSPDPIVEFSEGMSQLLDCVQENGAVPIVLAQPALWKAQMSEKEQAALWFFVNTPSGRVRPSTAWLQRELAAYNQAQERQAAARGARYVPLDRVVPQTLEYFYDDCHVTDKGSAAVAEAAFPAVKSAVDEVLARRRW